MAYKEKKDLAHKSNYGGKRSTKNIKYIVIHYTGNDGDTDESNANYFNKANRKASAHYFVDDDSVTQSVPDNYVAWSVGGNKYNNNGGKYHGKCTNANSLSIEICDDVKNGKVYPSAKTIANAIEFTKKKMKKYNIDADHVIRHYDVNGKSCPAYWCGTTSKDKKWKTEFHNKLTQKNVSFEPYEVKITASKLKVREGAGTKYKVVEKIKKNEIYTIIEEKKSGHTKWGKLKSGIGWISLSYTKKVK